MAYKKPQTDDTNPTETSAESMDFSRMLEESFSKSERKISVGDRIKSEVLSVGKEHVIVSTGTRFDGFVQAQQLQDETGQPTVKSGDHVDLFVTYVNGSQIFLSPKPTSKNLADDIQDAFTKDLPVEGRVDSINKGGFQVIVLGKQAFCPLSQMDLKRIEKPEDYVGKKFTFKITQFSEGGRNIVLSRRKLMEEGQGVALASFKDQTKVGDVVTGTVTRIESFGAFIEIAPGLEGLAHISELSWTRIKDPSEVVKVGQSVTATILRIEAEDRRLKISLTLKQSAGDPWQNLPSHIQTGRVVAGKVTRCMPFGAFVELHPGIEGLIPLSEMSSTKRVARADEVVKEGDPVSVMVKEITPQTKRISLSIKDAVGEAANALEAQNIKDYSDSELARGGGKSMGTLAEKFQAALDKKSEKKNK
jgi:small subunit ribosomal protein S1